jgi:myosin heavy chain 9/10/11/14
MSIPSAAKRDLQKHLQEEQLAASASSAATSGTSCRKAKCNSFSCATELRAVVESYQAKEQSYQQRFEAAEIARAKAARAEAFGKHAQKYEGAYN